jgi:hypothetical protein
VLGPQLSSQTSVKTPWTESWFILPDKLRLKLEFLPAVPIDTFARRWYNAPSFYMNSLDKNLTNKETTIHDQRRSIQ